MSQRVISLSVPDAQTARPCCVSRDSSKFDVFDGSTRAGARTQTGDGGRSALSSLLSKWVFQAQIIAVRFAHSDTLRT